MKIKSIEIKNFKSIKHLEIHCNKGMNAFIGKNGTGKSAVFEAVNFLLGEVYPTANSFQEDWFNDDNEELLIKIEFYEPYHTYESSNRYKTYQNTIKGISFQAWYDKGSKLQTVLRKNEDMSYIDGNDGRDPHRINYIGSNRTVKSIMPTNSWSLLGRQFYSSDFFTDEIRNEFEASMSNAKASLEKSDKFKNFIESVQAKLSTQINRQDLKSEFKMYDTNHFLKTLEFYIEKNGKKINLTDEGSGIQNSFILGVIQALSETDFRKNNKQSNNPIFIDEPELYLHPHAKKSLYNTLKNLSEDSLHKDTGEVVEGTQVFYITHSAEFLSYEDNDNICIFKNTENGTSIIQKTVEQKEASKVEARKIKEDLIPENIELNSAFFADTIIIAEGISDKMFISELIKHKTSKCPEDFNITIINAGGKDQQHLLNMIYKYFDKNLIYIRDYDFSNKSPSYPTELFKELDIEDNVKTLFSGNSVEDIKSFQNVIIFKDDIECYLMNEKIANKQKIPKMREWLCNLDDLKKSKLDEIWTKFEPLLNKKL